MSIVPVARSVNLAIPGGGLILVGRVTSGVVVALLFAVSGNAAIVMRLLLPDEFPAWLGGLCLGIAAGTYIGAQLRLAHVVRLDRDDGTSDRRRRILAEVCDALARGEPDVALRAIEPLEPDLERDLLISYRYAQILTAQRDVPRARAAWRQTRRLDRHHIYRHEISRHERLLEADEAASGALTRDDPRDA